MTIRDLVLILCVYAVALTAVVSVARPTWRRLVGAAAGGAAVAALGLAAVPLGEARGLWRVPLDPSPGYLALAYLGGAVSAVPIFLVTWRIARRFGRRGMAVVLAAAAAIGPPREFAVGQRFPEWITYTPGAATVLAIIAVYVGGIAAGHGVMRLAAGPARGSRLARWPWEAEPAAAPGRGEPA